jgi:hypothetical protein
MYGCFAFIHVVMGIVYAFYYFGIAGSSKNEFLCVTNQVEFKPYPYANETDLFAYLNKPGTENVTE